MVVKVGEFVPASATKDQKKGRTAVVGAGEDGSQDEGMQQTDICDSINTADIHEIVVTRVNETLTAYKKAQGEFDSPVIKQLVPALATAVAVAVSEAMKGVMRTTASHGHGTSAMSTATENSLFASVTSLTYENDRLQQYSRRESVRIFGIRQAEGETAEQVEQKALGVFREAGADVKEEDIAAVHRVGKVGRGLRPILVKFVSRRKRREVMEKKSLKGKDGYQKLYINDNLTPLRAKLLALVKRLDNVDKAWTVGGSIHCTKKVPPGLAPGANQRPVVVIDTAPRRSRRVLPLERTRGLSSSSTLLTICSSWAWNRLTSGPLL